MVHKRRSDQKHLLAVSDEAAAYIADALMQLALDFENTHYAQIRRYHRKIAPVPHPDTCQLDLFRQSAPRDPG